MDIDYQKVERLVKYVLAKANRGDAASVLNTMDDFCYTQEWCMNVGDVKGQIVADAIVNHKPKIIIEIGGYCGYSSIKFATLIKDDPKAHYYTIEYDAILTCVIEKASKMVKLAGLENKVTVLQGNLQANIELLRERYNITTVDFLFIDHSKSRYLPDFQLAESSGLFHSGSVIAADNIIHPGAPDYLSYMQSHKRFKSQLIDTELEYSRGQTKDAVLISICVD
ncbi:hypothetical protein L0F63_005424 [Massospora cicadina]|nr:hypothetical protein L0F63_005424 [Massospora cicadina]